MSPHIMAIDDDPHILESYQRVLTPEGYDVTTFVDPGAALHMTGWIRPDVIILDLHLKISPTTTHSRVLIITAAVHSAQGITSELNAQHIPILYKPFYLDDLRSAVQRLVPAHPHRE